MHIGKALKYGNPGEKIAVQLLNGKVVNVVAGNVINSTQVLVVGGYCWSSTSPVEQTRDRRVFKNQKTPKTEGETCQLVAASVFRGSVALQDINTLPPYDIAPYSYRAIIPENPSWKYNSSTDDCELVDDGSGEYSTLEQCFTAHKTGILDRAIYTERQTVIRADIEIDTAPTLPQNQSSVLQEASGSSRLGDSPILDAVPRYAKASNGDIVESRRTFALFGLDTYNNYRIQTRIRSPTTLLSSQTPETWLYAKFYIENEPIEVTATYFDGSIIKIRNGQEAPVNSGGYSCVGKDCRKFHPEIYNFDSIKDPFNDLKYRIELPFPFGTTTNGTLSYPANYFLAELKISLDIRTTIFRDTTLRYKTSYLLDNILVKFHDPDLSLIKAFEYQREKTMESTFIFLGNKAYLINKLEKIKVPEIAFAERPWFKVVVVELTIEQNEENYVINKQEFIYYNPEGFVVDNKNILNPVTDRYETSAVDNPCFDGEYAFSNIFPEVSYQKFKDGTIIEFKVPGRLLFAD